jgi:hypothetical protein
MGWTGLTRSEEVNQCLETKLLSTGRTSPILDSFEAKHYKLSYLDNNKVWKGLSTT